MFAYTSTGFRISKGGFWFIKKFSLELAEEPKKVTISFNQHFKKQQDPAVTLLISHTVPV